MCRRPQTQGLGCVNVAAVFARGRSAVGTTTLGTRRAEATERPNLMRNSGLTVRTEPSVRLGRGTVSAPCRSPTSVLFDRLSFASGSISAGAGRASAAHVCFSSKRAVRHARPTLWCFLTSRLRLTSTCRVAAGTRAACAVHVPKQSAPKPRSAFLALTGDEVTCDVPSSLNLGPTAREEEAPNRRSARASRTLKW